MAAPAPRVGDEERQDWEEGTGKCSSLPCCRDLHEVLRRVHERLRRTRHGHDQPLALDDAAESSFQRRLAVHLKRLPPRYLADVDADDKAEDVLLHWRILDQCVDPDKRPVFYARYVKSITFWAGYNGSSDEELEKPCQRWMMEDLGLERKAVDDTDPRITSRSRVIPLHEIIFCSLDRPKLLSRLAALLDEVGLHIREGHLYCTTDGFCLAVFLVDGWETEETDGLIAKIYEALALKNAQQSNSTTSLTSEKMLDLQQKLEILKLTGGYANKGKNIAS